MTYRFSFFSLCLQFLFFIFGLLFLPSLFPRLSLAYNALDIIDLVVAGVLCFAGLVIPIPVLFLLVTFDSFPFLVRVFGGVWNRAEIK